MKNVVGDDVVLASLVEQPTGAKGRARANARTSTEGRIVEEKSLAIPSANLGSAGKRTRPWRRKFNPRESRSRARAMARSSSISPRMRDAAWRRGSRQRRTLRRVRNRRPRWMPMSPAARSGPKCQR